MTRTRIIEITEEAARRVSSEGAAKRSGGEKHVVRLAQLKKQRPEAESRDTRVSLPA